ncbi:DUF2975 domain-containing protein [Clostridium sp.]|uniref:DUF2975 domain-containing protein n=1 Tax=Clostridium sp. TaxID=1506 RepID=UPI0025C333F4|nr:DUF2975 domain-containing protein [Clostridium sp.]
MKQKTTVFFKLAIIFISITVFALCVFGFYFLANNSANPDYAYILYPILIGIYTSVIPFYIALYKSFKLLSYISKNKASSQASVKALITIKYCAITISTLYLLVMPFIILLADKDDAPGAILIGALPILISIIIAVFANGLKKKLQRSIE